MLKKSLVLLTMFIIPFAVAGSVSAESRVAKIASPIKPEPKVIKMVNDYIETDNSYNKTTKRIKNTSTKPITVDPIARKYTPGIINISTYNQTEFKNYKRVPASKINNFSLNSFLKEKQVKIVNSKVNVQKNNTPSANKTRVRVSANTIVNPVPARPVASVARSVRSLYNEALGNDSQNKRVAFGEISKYQWNIVDAMNVSFCESRYTRKALNHSSIERSLGLFQINLQAHSRSVPGNNLAEKSSWLYTPANNVKFAYRLWSTEGWRPWLNCSRKLGLLH